MHNNKEQERPISPPPEGIETITQERALQVRIPETKLNEMRDEMAAKELLLKDVREEQKDAAAGYRTQIRDITLRLQELAKAIDSGEEDGQVLCTITKNYYQNAITVVREDTKEVIEGPRAMEPDEIGDRDPRQQKLV